MKSALLRAITTLTAVCMAAVALVSCSTINDDLSQCPKPKLTVRYVYDRNMEYANAFHAQVKSVALYVYDQQGRFVTGYENSGLAIADEDFRQTLELPEGRYTLVAWCGLQDGSFTVTGGEQGTSFDVMRTSMNSYNPATLTSDEELSPLWHGKTELTVEKLTEDRQITIDLTKDTNNIKVILQHLNGEPVDDKLFYFMVSDANTAMKYDNSMATAAQVYYYPFEQNQQSVGSNGGEGTTQVAFASMSTARLMSGNQPRLKVVLKERVSTASTLTPDMSRVQPSSLGNTIVDIPLNDYILLTKPTSAMDDQEYLDRQSNYSLLFFLDENHLWINTVIYINSWRIVLNDQNI